MVFPRSAQPHLIDVIRSYPSMDSYYDDEDDSPTYEPFTVIQGRPGRFTPKRTVADRLVSDGVNVSGTILMPYESEDVIQNSDEVLVWQRLNSLPPERYKVFTVHRQDLNRRPSHWEIEVVRHG